MVRKVYWDFAREKMLSGAFGWLLRRGLQYALIHASRLAGRPLCGPILGTVVTNYTCNYRCGMCELPLRDEAFRRRGLRDLDTAGMVGLLRDLAALGVSGVGFTGGEPLLRPDIFELLAHARSLGMISHLNTNGYLLTDRRIGDLLAARVDSINISLDGATASTHDAVRGRAGAFDRTVDGIGRLLAARDRTGASLRVKTVTVLDRANIAEVSGLLALARDLGVDCVEFIPRQPFSLDRRRPDPPDPAFLSQVDRAAATLRHYAEERPTIENSPAHLRLFRYSFLAAPSPLRCYASYNSLAVDCYGEIYPCVPWYNWGKSVGNVREAGLRKFWYSAAYTGIRRNIDACRDCYLNCQAELNILFNRPVTGRERVR